MTWYRCQEEADDFQDLIGNVEKDYASAFGGDAATREEFVAEAVTKGIGAEGLDAGPETPEVPRRSSPRSDRAEVVHSGLGEHEFQAWLRTVWLEALGTRSNDGNQTVQTVLKNGGRYVIA